MKYLCRRRKLTLECRLYNLHLLYKLEFSNLHVILVMANPRQRRKARSSSHRPISHSRHAKRNMKKVAGKSYPPCIEVSIVMMFSSYSRT